MSKNIRSLRLDTGLERSSVYSDEMFHKCTFAKLERVCVDDARVRAHSGLYCDFPASSRTSADPLKEILAAVRGHPFAQDDDRRVGWSPRYGRDTSMRELLSGTMFAPTDIISQVYKYRACTEEHRVRCSA